MEMDEPKRIRIMRIHAYQLSTYVSARLRAARLERAQVLAQDDVLGAAPHHAARRQEALLQPRLLQARHLTSCSECVSSSFGPGDGDASCGRLPRANRAPRVCACGAAFLLRQACETDSERQTSLDWLIDE